MCLDGIDVIFKLATFDELNNLHPYIIKSILSHVFIIYFII